MAAALQKLSRFAEKNSLTAEVSPTTHVGRRARCLEELASANNQNFSGDVTTGQNP